MATFLVTLSGPDLAGLGARIFAALDALESDGATLRDVTQVGVRDHVILNAELAYDARRGAERIREALTRQGVAGSGLTVTIEEFGARASDGVRLLVTVVAPTIRAGDLGAIFAAAARAGATSERVTHLGAHPADSYELVVRAADEEAVRAALAAASVSAGLDLAVQRSGPHRRAKHLVVMDADSTLLVDEVIDLLAGEANRADEVSAITEAAMAGELDFAESLRRRVALLAGLPATVLDEVRARLRLTPGADTLLRTLERFGYVAAVVSGGFVEVLEPLMVELGVPYLAANRLEIVDGRLTGQLVGPIVDRAAKAAALRRFADAAGVALAQTVAVGDGANDVDMISEAGLGIAFNAKATLREAADASLSVPQLDAVLYFLGISREEVEAG